MANFYHSENGQEVLLHRTKVDGHPEYNRMEADLEMAQDKKVSFGPDSNDSRAELAADKFYMWNKDDEWKTDIGPAEIRLEGKSSGKKSYVANDTIHMGNRDDNWTTDIFPAEIRMNSNDSGNNSRLDNGGLYIMGKDDKYKSSVKQDEIKVEDDKKHSATITPTSIRVGEIFADKITLVNNDGDSTTITAQEIMSKYGKRKYGSLVSIKIAKNRIIIKEDYSGSTSYVQRVSIDQGGVYVSKSDKYATWFTLEGTSSGHPAILD